jgi:tannase/feruloyl esterase
MRKATATSDCDLAGEIIMAAVTLVNDELRCRARRSLPVARNTSWLGSVDDSRPFGGATVVGAVDLATRGSSLRSKVLSAFTALGVAVLGLGLAPTGAAAETTSTIRPVRQCAELVKGFDIPGAATHVTAASVVSASASEPAHCDVRGYVEPAVQFQLRLPTATFAGRYLQYGCGGFCGVISPAPFPDCGGPHGGDLAVAVTNDGHVAALPAVDGAWANNQVARNDWFYRAPHVLSRAAKQIIAAYYGASPTHSYFSSCSNGGREALLLAQRYPNDFDGIIAGAPAHYLGPLFGVYQTWLARTNTAANGAPIITSAKLPALHNAVVAACDGLDGLVDGQIDDPRDCRFDPVTLQCPTGTDQPSCLTPAQVDAARTLYTGPTDAHGRRLYPGGQTLGSELAWASYSWIVPPPEGGRSTAELLADIYLKYVGYPLGTPHSSVADFEFTVGEFDRLRPEGVKGNAMSLDLEKFRRSGGKLIIWHGWDDQAVPATGSSPRRGMRRATCCGRDRCSRTPCGRSTTAPAASTTRATSFPLRRCLRRTTPSAGSARICMPSLDR